MAKAPLFGIIPQMSVDGTGGIASLQQDIGGAGLLDIELWYEALTRKQAIRFLTQPESSWVRLTRAKYN